MELITAMLLLFWLFTHFNIFFYFLEVVLFNFFYAQYNMKSAFLVSCVVTC